MPIKIAYDKTDIDKDTKIAEQESSGKVLVEVQKHEDGDFLVFADASTTISAESRLTAIEARLTTLEKVKV